MGLLAEAAQMNNLALAYRSRGMLDSALALHQQALRLFQEAGDKDDEASVLANMGLIYQETGELEKAMEHYRSALKIDSTEGNLMGQAGDLTNIGSVLEQEGKLSQAKEFYYRALALFDRMEAIREAEFVRQNIKRIDDKSKE
jgi:tetratricopeptide (TPR) repeat protein